MKPLTARRYWLCIGLCCLATCLLLMISPGIGTTSGSFGLWDVWRAKLGISIQPEEILDRPHADIDGDGTISEEEANAYIENARNIGFSQRLPRSLLALLVGITHSRCAAAPSRFSSATRSPRPTPSASQAADRSAR